MYISIHSCYIGGIDDTEMVWLLHARVCIYIYIYMYVYVVPTYIYIYIHTHIYIHTYIHSCYIDGINYTEMAWWLHA